MVPKNEKQDLDKYDIHLSEQLSKLFSEVEDGSGGEYLGQEDDQKINELPIPELTEILSKIDKDEVPKQLDFFEGDQNKEFEKKVKQIGLSTDSIEFLEFLQSSFCQELLIEDKLKIHNESGNIFFNNLETNESIYGFFQQQENQSKAIIKHRHFTFTDSYEDYFEWLVHGFKGNEDQKHNVLTNKNSKYLFYQFNDYLEHIFEPIKRVRHSVITDDDLVLEVIQNKNRQYFIETILIACKTNNGGMNNTVDLKNINLIKNSRENITICKQKCLSFYNQISRYLENTIKIYQQMKEMKLIMIYKEIIILLTQVRQMNFPTIISQIL